MSSDQSASAGSAEPEAPPDTDESADSKLVGQGISRREDRALLTGNARFTDDVSDPATTYLTFVRSEQGHARIEDVDVSAAASMDGVVAVYTWDDLAAADRPMVLSVSTGALDCDPPGHPVLARDVVRYQGQPVAAVVAEDRYLARDGARAVSVTYDPLDAVVDTRDATEPDAPTLYDEAPDNVVNTAEIGDEAATDDALADADHVVERDLRNNRLIPSALEPRAAVASYDAGTERLTVEMTTQSPHGHRGDLATTLGLPERRIRVVAPDVGGGFGHKGHHHPGEAMAGWAALALERPVKWTATRSENYLEGAHGRDHRTTARLGVDDDGTVRGLRVETDANVGGFGLGGSLMMPGWYGSLLSCQYDIPAIYCETRAVFTTTAPIHSYRGAGRPEAVYVTERLVDAAARELGFDPVELRRRNQIDPDQFPYETAAGATYDSGDYETAMDRALDVADYGAHRDRASGANESDPADGAVRDDDGRLRGVGVGCYVESTGGGFESGVVRVLPDGTVTVAAGTHSHGQGHGTTYAQIVADELEVPYDDVDVHEGDSDEIPTGTGTFGSRSTIVGGNAIAEAAREVRAKARRFAAELLDVPVEDVAYSDGAFTAASGEAQTGDDGSVTFEDVADAAYGWGVPDGMDPGLEATSFYEQEATAYSFGTHVVEVAVDPDTGSVEIERYVAVDDCGPRVNPTIVEGQIHGGVAQGVGQARSEKTVYGEDGDLQTDLMLRYGVPRAENVPEMETDSTVTPAPDNALGVKGIGEAGTMAAPPAVVNAVLDAVAPLGVESLDMPLTDETVWTAIRDADG